jgi:hypothetical protein
MTIVWGIGSTESVRIGVICLTIWTLMALVAIVAAVVALES